jgi:uncharacterized protein (DUF302 family)
MKERIMKTENTIATKDVLDRTGMKVRTNVKAGKLATNHNQTMAKGLRVRTNIKAGKLATNHNQTVAMRLPVRTNVKAGKPWR